MELLIYLPLSVLPAICFLCAAKVACYILDTGRRGNFTSTKTVSRHYVGRRRVWHGCHYEPPRPLDTLCRYKVSKINKFKKFFQRKLKKDTINPGSPREGLQWKSRRCDCGSMICTETEKSGVSESLITAAGLERKA